ncbi:hypothetical protein BGX27_006510, partial [Mortierella sp. AM989]
MVFSILDKDVAYISKINDVAHTHPLNEDLNMIGAEAQRRMTELHEKVAEYVADDFDTSKIRDKLSKKYPDEFILAKTIYDAVFKIKQKQREEEIAINPSESQALIGLLEECRRKDPGWFFSKSVDQETKALHRVFWMSPSQRKLYRRYRDIIVQDNTSQSNKLFQMALFVAVDNNG